MYRCTSKISFVKTYNPGSRKRSKWGRLKKLFIPRSECIPSTLRLAMRPTCWTLRMFIWASIFSTVSCAYTYGRKTYASKDWKKKVEMKTFLKNQRLWDLFFSCSFSAEKKLEVLASLKDWMQAACAVWGLMKLAKGFSHKGIRAREILPFIQTFFTTTSKDESNVLPDCSIEVLFSSETPFRRTWNTFQYFLRCCVWLFACSLSLILPLCSAKKYNLLEAFVESRKVWCHKLLEKARMHPRSDFLKLFLLTLPLELYTVFESPVMTMEGKSNVAKNSISFDSLLCSRVFIFLSQRTTNTSVFMTRLKRGYNMWLDVACTQKYFSRELEEQFY